MNLALLHNSLYIVTFMHIFFYFNIKLMQFMVLKDSYWEELRHSIGKQVDV